MDMPIVGKIYSVEFNETNVFLMRITNISKNRIEGIFVSTHVFQHHEHGDEITILPDNEEFSQEDYECFKLVE